MPRVPLHRSHGFQVTAVQLAVGGADRSSMVNEAICKSDVRVETDGLNYHVYATRKATRGVDDT
jgi:hypothetical protein